MKERKGIEKKKEWKRKEEKKREAKCKLKQTSYIKRT